MVLQRVAQPKTRRTKAALLEREPKIIENTKTCMFIKGGNTSDIVGTALKELYLLKKPEAISYRWVLTDNRSVRNCVEGSITLGLDDSLCLNIGCPQRLGPRCKISESPKKGRGWAKWAFMQLSLARSPFWYVQHTMSHALCHYAKYMWIVTWPGLHN